MKSHLNKLLISFFNVMVISRKTFITQIDELHKIHAQLLETQNSLREVNFDLFYQKKRSEILRILYSQKVSENLKIFCAQNLEFSNSQLLQDLIVSFLQSKKISEEDRHEGGFFCEIGGADGIKLSNTYLLENRFHWKGIIAEPARLFKNDLIRNRKSTLSFLCLHNKSGEKLTFNETSDPFLSTIDSYSQNDMHGGLRENGTKYEVETITLLDLLKKFDAPKYIDYLSIDTEGSEFEILKNFDFSSFSFGFLSVEHNYSSTREDVYKLLSKHGYERILTEVSMWDDFYISRELLPILVV